MPHLSGMMVFADTYANDPSVTEKIIYNLLNINTHTHTHKLFFFILYVQINNLDEQ